MPRHATKLSPWLPLILAAGWPWTCTLAQPATPVVGPDPLPSPIANPDAIAFTPLAHVEVRGSGPIPLLLLSEANADWTLWQTFMDRNLAQYTMYAVTLPGVGGTTAPPQPAEGTGYTHRPWQNNAVAAIVKLIDERSLDKPLVIGISMGGYLAQRLAIEHPEKIRGAISLDGPPAIAISGPTTQVMTPQERGDFINNQLAPSVAALAEPDWKDHWRMVSRGACKDQARAQAIGEMLASTEVNGGARYVLECLSHDLTEDLKGAKMPVAIVATIPDEDMFYGSRRDLRIFWHRVSKLNPNVQFVAFEDTRRLVTEDSPAELDRAVTDFLAGKPITPKKVRLEMFGPAIELGLPRISGEAPPEPPRQAPPRVPTPPIRRPTLNPDGTPKEVAPAPSGGGGLFHGKGNPPPSAPPAASPAKPAENPPR